MAITRENYASNDGLWDLVRKILNNLNGLIRGDFGILTRGTFELAPSTSTTATTLARGTATVVTAGTPVQLAGPSTLVDTVIIVPARGATGRQFIGSTNAASAPSVELPVTLNSPEGKKLDLSLFFIDSTVSGQGVVWESIT